MEEKRKILFLGITGVVYDPNLNLDVSREVVREFGLKATHQEREKCISRYFDAESIHLLNSILEDPQIDIVICPPAEEDFTLEEIQYAYGAYNFSRRIVGTWPSMSNGEFRSYCLKGSILEDDLSRTEFILEKNEGFLSQYVILIGSAQRSRRLSDNHLYNIVCPTKGELLSQENVDSVKAIFNRPFFRRFAQ